MTPGFQIDLVFNYDRTNPILKHFREVIVKMLHLKIYQNQFFVTRDVVSMIWVDLVTLFMTVPTYFDNVAGGQCQDALYEVS